MVAVLGTALTQFAHGDISHSYVTDGLLVWFDGIENAGPGVHSSSPSAWYDLTGNGNAGTITSSALTWGRTGWINSSNGHPISIETDTVLNALETKTFTIEIAVTPSRSNARQAFYSQYLGYSGTSVSFRGFAFEHNSATVSTGALRLYCDNRPDWTSSINVIANEPAAVSAIVTAGRQRLFKNGAIVGQNDKNIAADAVFSPVDVKAEGRGFGRSIVGSDYSRSNMAFRGTYHAFRCYNRALTPAEVAVNSASDRVRLFGENMANVELPDGYEFDGQTNVLYRVSASASTTSGRVSMDGGAAAQSVSAAVLLNDTTNVTLTATAQTGSTFLGWEGDVDAISSGSASSATVTVTARRAVSLMAVFRTSESVAPESAQGKYVTDGLVCWMDGVDNAGMGSHSASATTWSDLSGNNYNGTMSAKFGNGLVWTDFGWSNGVDGQPVLMPTSLSSVLANNRWTLEFAVTPSRDSVRQSFFAQYNNGGFSIEHNQGGVTSGALRLYYNNTPNYCIEGAIMPAGALSTVSLASTPGVQDVNLNGIPVFIGTSSATAPVSNKPFYVGGDPTRPAMAFRGTYHALRLYNRILTQAERRQNALADLWRFRDANSTLWTNATGTAWLDEANWTRGVPNLRTPAFICADAPTLSLTVPNARTALTNLTVVNATGLTTITVPAGRELAFRNTRTFFGAGSRLEVPTGGLLSYDGAGKTPSSSIMPFIVADGGELRIAGGDVSFTNFTGRLYIAGNEDETGRVSVTEGSLRITTSQSSVCLYVGAGGRLDASNAQIALNYTDKVNVASTTLPDLGGEIDLSGTTRMEFGNSNWLLGSGRVRLSGTSALQIALSNFKAYTPTLSMNPSVGGTCELTVDDSASIDFGPGNATVHINRGVAGGRSVFNWNSSKTFSALNSLCVGFKFGTGILNVSKGVVEGGLWGLRVAQPSGNGTATDFPTGIVNVVGGILRCRDCANESGDSFNGLIVGAGNVTKLNAPGFYRGTINITGGEVQSKSGYFGIGIGVAEGDIVQTGGKVTHTSSDITVIGAWGGEGRWSMTNGVATLSGDVYVGGVLTNHLTHPGYNLYQCCPVTNHAARGSLAVAGGTFTVSGKLHAGEDGTARISVGPDGTISAASADIVNTAINVKFGESGVGCFEVANGLTIGSNVTLDVDTTAFNGRSGSYPFITVGGTTTGNFASVRLNGPGVLVQTTIGGVKGWRLDLHKGTCLIFK